MSGIMIVVIVIHSLLLFVNCCHPPSSSLPSCSLFDCYFFARLLPMLLSPHAIPPHMETSPPPLISLASMQNTTVQLSCGVMLCVSILFQLDFVAPQAVGVGWNISYSIK